MKMGISIELDSGNPVGHRLFERTGYAVLCLFVLAAAAGLLGTGPLTRITKLDGGLQITYPLTTKIQEEIEIVVTLPTGTDSLTLDRELMDALHIDSIDPEPNQERMAAADAHRWDFEQGEVVGPLPISIHARPRQAGLLRGSIQSNTSSPIPLTLLVYP